MKKSKFKKSIISFTTGVFIPFILIIFLVTCQDSTISNSNQRKNDLEAVKNSIHNVFAWAVNKDFDLFFNTISDDSNFISVTPYQRVKFGVQAVKADTAFWASPYFKAVRHELHDLHINFSSGENVAWFYCLLDDINTWKGKPANWENLRWTGVLEKKEGKWRVVQQHFSWPKVE